MFVLEAQKFSVWIPGGPVGFSVCQNCWISSVLEVGRMTTASGAMGRAGQ